MFESAADVIKTAGLFLAIVIPAIAAWFSYRREERKRAEQPPSVGLPGLAAIGAAVATESVAARQIEQEERVHNAIERLIDELRATRRAIEDLRN